MNKFLEQYGKLGYSAVEKVDVLPNIDIAEDYILVKIELRASHFGEVKIDETAIVKESIEDFWNGTIVMVGGKNEYLMGKKVILKGNLRAIPFVAELNQTPIKSELMFLTHISNIVALSHSS